MSAFQWVGRTGRELEDWMDEPFISDRLLATFTPIEAAYYAGKLDLVGLGKYAGQRMKWRAWTGFTAEDVASFALEKMLAPKSEGGYGHVPPEDELWRKLAYKIVKHKVVDLMKLDRGDVLLDPELDDSELAEPVVQGWWSDATREWVESTCTEREASVLFLRFCLDWSVDTVGDFLSISHQAVSAHVGRAAEKLKVAKNTSQTLY